MELEREVEPARFPWGKRGDRVRYTDVNPNDLKEFARSLRHSHDWTANIGVNGGLLIQGDFRNAAEYGAFVAGIEFAHLIINRQIRTYDGSAPRDD